MAEITAAELETLKEVFAEFKSSGGTVKDFARGLSLAGKEGDTLGGRFKSAGLQVFDGATSFTKSMANGTQGAAAFTGVISATSGGLSTLLKDTGFAGAAISKLGEFSAEYVNRALIQSDALFASFQGLSKIGGAGVDGMKGVFDSLHQFGMTMDQLPQFGAMIAQNSEALAKLGGTVNQGIKAFAGVASGIQQSGLQAQFERMGISVQAQNEGVASYLRLETLRGASANKTQAQLTEGAAEYIRQQDRLTKLTGKSADTLAKEEEARMSDQRYRALSREMQQKADAARAAGDIEGAKAIEAQMAANQELLANTPKELQKGVQDLMSGVVNSPEAQKMYTSMPQMSQTIMSQNFKASEVITAGAQEAKGALDRNTALAKAGLSNQVNADFAGLANLEAKNRVKTATENEKAAKDAQDKLAQGANVDVNNQVAMRQAQRATTTAMEQLVEKGTGPLLSGLTALSTKIASVTTAIPGVSQQASLTPTPTPEQLAAGIKAGKSVEEVMKGLARGTAAPATAGYNSDIGSLPDSATLKNSWDKFLNAVTGSVEQQAPVDTNGRVIFPSAAAASTTSSVPAGPTDRASVRLEGVRPENVQTDTRANSTSVGTTDSLAEVFRTLAGSISQQTQSMDDMVDLMRRSLGVQGRILQQSRN
jgi:hypothetical protein